MSKAGRLSAALLCGFWLAILFYPPTIWGQPSGGRRISVIYNFTPFSAVGKKKAGLLCAPNGKLIWSDIAPINPASINSIMEIAFRNEAEKLNIDMQHMEITAYIDHVNISACAKNWAFGDEDTYKGRGTLVVEWKFEGKYSAVLTGLASTSSFFELNGTKQPLEAAFEAAARDVLTNFVAPARESALSSH